MPLVQLLRRFDFTVLKNKSASDAAQVPTAATLSFHRQGATVKSTINLLPSDPPVGRDIQVDDAGQIAVGDLVAIGFNGPQYEVTGLIGRTKVTILYTGTSSLQVTAGTRLVAPGVQAYKDGNGSQPLTAPYQSDATSGRYSAYIAATRYDFTVTVSGLPVRTYIDHEGGPSISALGWLQARDFGSLDAAIAACPDGRETTIALEPFTYLLPDTLVIPPSKSIRLLGAGREQTTLTCTDADQASVWIRGSRCGLESLTVRGPGPAGTGAGIVIGRLASQQPVPPDIIRYTTLRDVLVEATPSWGLDILGMDHPGADLNTLSIFGRFTGLTIRDNRSGGCLRIQRGNTTQAFDSSQFINFVSRSARIEYADDCSFHQCTFEGQPGADPAPFVDVVESGSVAFTSCWFEEDPAPAPPPDAQKGWFLRASGVRTAGLTMLGCSFHRPTGYRTAAVLLEACPGAVIMGMETRAPSAAQAGQSRDDVVLTRVLKPGGNPNLSADYSYPDLTLIGGAAVSAAGPSRLAVNISIVDPNNATPLDEIQISSALRVFQYRSFARLAWQETEDRTFLYDSPDSRVPGSMFYNATTNRLEYFDGTTWRYLQGVAFTPPTS